MRYCDCCIDTRLEKRCYKCNSSTLTKKQLEKQIEYCEKNSDWKTTNELKILSEKTSITPVEITVADCGILSCIIKENHNDFVTVKVIDVLSKCYPKTTIRKGIMVIEKENIVEIVY